MYDKTVMAVTKTVYMLIVFGVLLITILLVGAPIQGYLNRHADNTWDSRTRLSLMATQSDMWAMESVMKLSALAGNVSYKADIMSIRALKQVKNSNNPPKIWNIEEHRRTLAE